MPLADIECVYFDEKDAYFFDPDSMAGAEHDPAELPDAPPADQEAERFRLYPADRSNRGPRRAVP